MTIPRAELISALLAAIGDSRAGLPEDVFRFVSRLTPLLNVDLLIQDERRRTLLTWRDDEFYGPGWHVPGGIVRFKETMVDRIRACARQELGAEVTSDAAPIHLLEGVRSEDTRGHHVSMLFRCRLLTPPVESLRASASPPSAGHWRWHDRCPPDLLEEQRDYARFF
jgi:ADP-ribose pyrophosphatase YjhB (NUDIX family)